MDDQKKLIQEVIKTLRYGAAHPNIVKVSDCIFFF